MELNKLVEEKAKELIIAGNFPGSFNGIPTWAKNIARHVLIRELKIRLDEVHLPVTLERIARIERQIKQLEELK